jgi:6-phosphofructokinase 2
MSASVVSVRVFTLDERSRFLMKPIVTLTMNPAIDGASEADVVRHTHKVRTTNEHFDPGGGGINVTRVIKELGGESIAVYLAGGSTGGVLDELLGGRGIARRRVPIAGNTRVSHVVFERSTGLEYRFIAEGPEVSEREWKRCFAVLEDLDWEWLVASGSLPRGVPADFYVQLSDLVTARGGKLVLDTSKEPLKLALEHGGLALVKPSHGEFETFVGRPLKTVADIAEAAQQEVLAGRAEMITVTMGHEGAVMATRDGTLHIAAPPVEVKSASGAGDSFLAGMVHALAIGWRPEDAFRLGVAAGTAAVLSIGTQLCRRVDVDRLYGEIRRLSGPF